MIDTEEITKRLTRLQVAHAKAGRGSHPLCNECGRSWPCTSYKIASLEDVGVVGDEPAARVAQWEQAVEEEQAP